MTSAILTLLLTLAFAAGPVLFPGFTGYEAGSFPIPQEAPPVQPAGYAFAIWGVIYLWLVLSAVWGAWRRRDDPGWARMRGPLNLSLALGAVWLPVAQASPLVATAMLWVMWAGAIGALFRAPVAERAFALWPVGLYAGWLSAASCVGLGLVLAGYGLMAAQPAALAMVALATVLAAAILLRLRRAPTFGLAVAWALAAVFVANADGVPQVAGLAMGGAIGIGALTLFVAYQEFRGRT